MIALLLYFWCCVCNLTCDFKDAIAISFSAPCAQVKLQFKLQANFCSIPRRKRQQKRLYPQRLRLFEIAVDCKYTAPNRRYQLIGHKANHILHILRPWEIDALRDQYWSAPLSKAALTHLPTRSLLMPIFRAISRRFLSPAIQSALISSIFSGRSFSRGPSFLATWSCVLKTCSPYAAFMLTACAGCATTNLK